jgi:hypothetical protein
METISAKVEVGMMARKWSGFLPQNQSIKEEWALLEACEAQARLAEAGSANEPEEEESPAGVSAPRENCPRRKAKR